MAKVLIGNFKGPQGDKGDKGDPGTAATIQVGTTQTVQPEENAEVTNTGTTTAAVLNFKIPRGEDGMTDLTAEYKDASEYTCEPTVNAPVVVKELDGKTDQTTTNGYQLFDASKLPTKTQGGATVTNNGDGSFTISGSGNLSDFFINYYNLTHEETLKLFKQGNITLACDTNSYPNFIFQIKTNDDTSNDSALIGIYPGETANITKEMLDNTLSFARFYIYGKTGNRIKSGTIKPIFYQDGDGTWEPYTGGSPAPSPDYPQVIKGVGGKAGGSDFSTEVETQGRNLFDASRIATASNSGTTVTNNGDGSFTVSGESSNSFIVSSYTIQHNETINMLKAGTLKLGTDKNTNPYFFFQVHNEDKSILKELHNSPTNAITSVEISESDLLDDTLSIWYGFYFSFNTLNPVTPGTIFPMVYQSGDGTFQPYHHTTLTIPLTAPLYDGDKICYVKPGESYVDAEGDTVVADGILYGVYRENIAAILDGSGDESLGKNAGGENIFSCTITNKVGSSNGGEQYLKCNKLTTAITNLSVLDMPDNSIKESGTMGSNVVFFNISEAGTTVESLRTWLSTNPLTVVYRLAQPYFEPFTDQSIFYGLRTADTLTYIYSSDPIEPNVTAEVAKNSTGGYLLESYAQAQKNAISEANSQSRISAIEQQLVNQATTPTE